MPSLRSVVFCAVFATAPAFAGAVWPINLVARSGDIYATYTSEGFRVSGFSALNSGSATSVGDDGSIVFVTHGYVNTRFGHAFYFASGTTALPWLIEQQATPVDPPGSFIANSTFTSPPSPLAGGLYIHKIQRFSNNTLSPALRVGNSSGSIDLVRSGQQADMLPAGTTYYDFAATFETRSSHIRFGASLDGPDMTPLNRRALFVNGANGIRMVARSGDPVLGATPGAVLGLFDQISRSRHDGGGFYRNQIINPDGHNQFSLWEDNPSMSPRAIAISNITQAPSIPGAVFQDTALNSQVTLDGRLMYFSGRVSGGGVTQANNEGIWKHTAGASTELLVRKGQVVSSPTYSRTLGILASISFSANSKGDFLFPCPTTDANGAPMYSMFRLTAEDTSPRLLYDFNRPLPGDPFGAGVFITSQWPTILNESGYAIFIAMLSGAGVTSANNIALVALLPDDTLSVLVRKGDLLEYAPGVSSRVSALPGMSGMGQITSHSFNDAGLFAFQARFENGADTILSMQVPCPTPSLILIAGIAHAASRRRVRR